MKMITYPDGTPVVVGDIIWNNEGLNVRKVLTVLSAKEMKATMGCNWGPGLLWTRYIGETNLGTVGCEVAKDFQKEGVGRLSLPELLCIRILFRLLGEYLGLEIWDNRDYLYYPVLHPEQQKDGTYRWVWYLYFQPYSPSITTFDEEECYRFDENRFTFDRMDRATQDRVRGL